MNGTDIKHTWILFAGSHYYPAGGAEDFKSSHTTLADAEAVGRGMIDRNDVDWAHAIRSDRPEKVIVISGTPASTDPEVHGRWARRYYSGDGEYGLDLPIAEEIVPGEPLIDLVKPPSS